VPRVQFGKVAHHGLLHRFEARVASYDVGAHKPEIAVFEAAREALDAETYVYVADNPPGDLDPAREAGFRCVHLDADADYPAVGDFDSLARLGELF